MIQIQPEYLIVLSAVLLALGIAIGELEAHWRRQRVRKNPFTTQNIEILKAEKLKDSQEVRRAILGKLERSPMSESPKSNGYRQLLKRV